MRSGHRNLWERLNEGSRCDFGALHKESGPSKISLAQFSFHSEKKNIGFYSLPAGGSQQQGRSTRPNEPEIGLVQRLTEVGDAALRGTLERVTVAAEQIMEASLMAAP